ncbi:hypothetical protein FWK50_06230 [Histophilus somni]|nr:hypothetical protein FWK47_06230 [Histophilus somni]QEH16393.1 hypothetical protein FWK50_06230 [Histophilus somni]TFI33050.1 hypothetical protein E4M08_06785 [Histophilus somni]THA42191.1 hypothetical protein E5428_07115 [Histophilus somni]
MSLKRYRNMTKIKFSVLLKNQSAVSIGDTTTKNGYRTRKTCGIFLPQIPMINGLSLLSSICLSEFVARLISGNKASTRTNNASRFFAVVETLLHPLGNSNSHLLNKETIKMLFKFILFLGENRLKLAIRANSEQQARNLLNLQSNALFIARINDKGGIYA